MIMRTIRIIKVLAMLFGIVLFWSIMFLQPEHGLSYIPLKPVKSSPNSEVSLLASHIQAPYLHLPPKDHPYTERVVILSPVRGASKWLHRFTNLISTLSYPHHLISVHFGEDGSTDDTYQVAKQLTNELKVKHGFQDGSVFKMNITGNNTTRESRHHANAAVDRERRIHLARARNLLTVHGYKGESWVLWIDSDVILFRTDVIEQFIHADKDVMSSSCLCKVTRFLRGDVFKYYDQNSFRESWENNTQHRIWLSDLKAEGRVAKLDSVGGCMLMVRGDCVRRGLEFTDDPYKHVIANYSYLETEGLAKSATDMGYSVYGLPFLEVFHVYEG